MTVVLIREENRPAFYRRLVLAAILGVLALWQSTNAFCLFGIRLLPLLPLVVCIGMFERETVGMLFGIFAGVLWDMNSPEGDGFHALVLAFAGFACGLLMTYVMRNNLVTAMLLCVFFILAHQVLHWTFFVALKGYPSALHVLLTHYLPSGLITVLLLPPSYYSIRAIMKATRKQKAE